MAYLIDTNILLCYLRTDKRQADEVDKTYAPFDKNSDPVCSVVSVGELKSLAIRNGWGAARVANIPKLLDVMLVADIHSDPILDRYAEIEAYSQGKLPGRPLATTARNMGKNDLWIAATASVLGLPLLTTDPDFAHLDQVFLTVHRVVL